MLGTIVGYDDALMTIKEKASDSTGKSGILVGGLQTGIAHDNDHGVFGSGNMTQGMTSKADSVPV